MKALALALIFSCLPAHAQQDGGGSSTGGGHVRVCLTPVAAEKVKAVMARSTLVPQISSNPFEGIAAEEILSVDLLDLLERPEIYQMAKPTLTQVASLVRKEGNYSQGFSDDSDANKNPNKGNDSVKMITQALRHVIELVAKSNGPEWMSDSTELPDNVSKAGRNDLWAPWTPSSTGLRITNDFDPRTQIADNCVFAQAVRQSVFTRHFATFDFDAALLSHMDEDNLIALGLHEGMYSAVMLAPNYGKIKNPSALTRRLTMLALGIASGHITEYEPEFRTIIESLGYRPFIFLQREGSAK